MRLLPYNAQLVKGRILFGGRNLYALSDEEVRQLRWKEVAMIFQAAMNSLNPVYSVGNQIIEAIVTHEPETGEDEPESVWSPSLSSLEFPKNAWITIPMNTAGV